MKTVTFSKIIINGNMPKRGAEEMGVSTRSGTKRLLQRLGFSPTTEDNSSSNGLGELGFVGVGFMHGFELFFLFTPLCRHQPK